MIFRLRLQAEVLGLKYTIEAEASPPYWKRDVSEGTRGGYMEQNVDSRNRVWIEEYM